MTKHNHPNDGKLHFGCNKCIEERDQSRSISQLELAKASIDAAEKALMETRELLEGIEEADEET